MSLPPAAYRSRQGTRGIGRARATLAPLAAASAVRGALLVSAGSNTTAGGWDDGSIEVLSFKTGQFRTVLRGGYFGRYLSIGRFTVTALMKY